MGELIREYSNVLTAKSNLPIATSARSGLVLQSDYFNGQKAGLNERTKFHEVPIGYITYRHMSDDATFHFNCNYFSSAVLVSKEYPVFYFQTKSDRTAVIEYLNNSNSFLRFCIIQKKGGTRTRLYYRILKTFQLRFGNHEEMKNISDILEVINNLIAANEGKKKIAFYIRRRFKTIILS